MKKTLFLLATLLPVFALGQSQDQNYILNTTYRNPNSSDPVHTISYFDGLGRPIEKVAHKQSATGKDIVTHIEYDNYGRQPTDFLPMVNGETLNYHGIASGEVASYYSSQPFVLPEEASVPFSEKVFEDSPLNRVLQQAAPGEAWAKGSGHEVKFDYQTNKEDEVRLFKVATSWDSGVVLYTISFLDNRYYESNQLYKTITKDENWQQSDKTNNTTEEFKDKEGRVVLKRTFTNYIDKYGDITQTQEPHDTYYVYDDFGNLTYVLPPLVNTSTSGTNPGTITQDILNDLCYQYKYDHRNRMVAKKLPGKQWEYIVYNNQDLPVATGPVKNPWGEDKWGWLITKYDVFGRVIYTGWSSMSVSAEERASFQSALGTDWAESFIDDGSIIIDQVAVSYKNNTYPTDFKLLTVNYYDTYDHACKPANIPDKIFEQDVARNVKSLATASWVRILDDPGHTDADISHQLYDLKGRVIRNFKTTYTGGYTTMDTKLDFTGKPLYTITKHRRNHDAVLTTVKDFYEYTPEDRLLVHKQQINNEEVQLIAKNDYNELGQLLTKQVGGTDVNTYAGLQKVDYRYNIRGWLKSINDVTHLQDPDAPNDPKDLFAFKITYNESDTFNDAGGQVKLLYNGNIAETYWKSSADNVLRKYGYRYDNLNRLNKAIYQKPDNNLVSNMYNEQMEYDKNGNIQHLLRNGDMDADDVTVSAFTIDDLTYEYDHEKANQLVKVTDITNAALGFKDDSDGTNDTESDYKYDDNGNMTRDDNKHILEITYNHLNLPITISFVGDKKIVYLYNATGQKVNKQVLYDNEVVSTDYLDGYQYTNGMMNFFPHAEGYVTVKGTSEQYKFFYVYNYTDHLGNIRVSYSKDPNSNELKILEENHYYPFGLKHTNYNAQKRKFEVEDEEQEDPNYIIKQIQAGEYMAYKYKFEGREWQDELGLNVYPFKYRTYDPAIGRFWSIDPVAENYPYNGVYNFAENRVVESIDLEGKESWFVQDGSLATKAGPYTSQARQQLNLYSPSEVQQMKAKQASYKGPMLSQDNLSPSDRKQQEARAATPTAKAKAVNDGKSAKERIVEAATATSEAAETAGTAMQLTAVVGGIGSGVTGNVELLPECVELFEAGSATKAVGQYTKLAALAIDGNKAEATLEATSILLSAVTGSWANSIPGVDTLTKEVVRTATDAAIDTGKNELIKTLPKK